MPTSISNDPSALLATDSVELPTHPLLGLALGAATVPLALAHLAATNVARLLVVTLRADDLGDPGSLAEALEAAERCVEMLTFSDSYAWHELFSADGQKNWPAKAGNQQ